MSRIVEWGMFGPTCAKPKIGKNVTMSGCNEAYPIFMDCQAQITIEDDVFMGHGVKILTGSHNYEKFGSERQTTLTPEPVTIKKGAWIASFALILPGVTIGEHSVIGAGSVVTHDVAPYTLEAGNPARFIKNIPHK